MNHTSSVAESRTHSSVTDILSPHFFFLHFARMKAATLNVTSEDHLHANPSRDEHIYKSAPPHLPGSRTTPNTSDSVGEGDPSL